MSSKTESEYDQKMDQIIRSAGDAYPKYGDRCFGENQ